MIRSLCYFTENPKPALITRLRKLAAQLAQGLGLPVQTLRIALPPASPRKYEEQLVEHKDLLIGLGPWTIEQAKEYKEDYHTSPRCFFYAQTQDAEQDAFWLAWLYETAQKAALKTFHYALSFEVPPSSPFFPSARFEQEGFSIGFQAFNWVEACPNPQAWLDKQSEIWDKTLKILAQEPDFLGIDSSLAPLGGGYGSWWALLERWGLTWEQAILSDFFTQLSSYLKRENPKPLGLCGLMFPCLEDEGLAQAYEIGAFSLERNLFVSLHSGLGVDTYPFGLDQNPAAFKRLIPLVRALSQKYKKPLSLRFISDGLARIGERTNFNNIYLKDVKLRALEL